VNPAVRALAVCGGVAAGIGLAAATLQARDRWFPRAPSEQRLLYLTNGRVADRLSLSFDSSCLMSIGSHRGITRRSASQRFSGTTCCPLLDLTTTPIRISRGISVRRNLPG
jgi:hypothetical protein